MRNLTQKSKSIRGAVAKKAGLPGENRHRPFILKIVGNRLIAKATRTRKAPRVSRHAHVVALSYRPSVAIKVGGWRFYF